MFKQVVADARGEPLSDGEDAELLHALQGEPQQHRAEIEPDDHADRGGQAQPRQPGKTGLSTQNADSLPQQNGLECSRKGQRKQEQQGNQKPPSIPNEVSAQTTDPAPVRDGSHQLELPAGVAARIASTMEAKGPLSRRTDRGCPTSRAVE